MRAFLILILVGIFACGGGGSSNPNAPVLTAVAIDPATVAVGSVVDIYYEFSFTDADGDLDGGTFSFLYNGETIETSLESDFEGLTDGIAGGYLYDSPISSETGDVEIPTWLTDSAGNESARMNVTLTQK